MWKNPEKAKGYSPYTVKETGDRCARLDNWVWDNNGGCTFPPREEHAIGFMDEVAHSDVTEATKGKTMEALLRYNAWLRNTFDPIRH